MADKQQLLQQLQELKALRNEVANMSDEEPQQVSEVVPQQNFQDSFGENLSLGTAAMAIPNAIGGMYDLASGAGKRLQGMSMSPISGAIALGQEFFKDTTPETPRGFQETVTDVARRTGQTVSGIFPGGSTAFDYLADVGTDREKTSEQYGQQLGQEVSAYAGGAALGALGGVANKALSNRGARRAAEIDVFNDPVSQAAIRQAESRDFLRTDPLQQAVKNQKITPELQQVAKQVQDESWSAVRNPDQDMIVPRAFGYPESSTSPRAAAAATQLAESSKSFLDTNILQGSVYNPRLGKFEGPAATPLNTQALLDRAEIASVQTIADRKTVAASLDQAHQAITANPALPNIPKIRIEDVKVGETVSELSDILQKRKLSVETSGVGEAMQRSLDNLQLSFNKINNENFYRNPNSPGVTISEAVSQLENLNAYRKALGEFDEAARANNLNSTVNDFQGRAAELYSLKKIQQSLQDAIKSQASTILSNSKSLDPMSPVHQQLLGITEETIPTQNKAYGAFQDAKEAITTQDVITERSFASQDPNRLVNIQKDPTMAEQISSPKRTFLEMIGLGGKQENLNLSRAEKALARPQQPIVDMLDNLLLRQKVVPILSRDWQTVKSSMDMFAEVRKRAFQMGVVASPEEFDSLSDPMQKEVFKIVAQQDPQGMETVPGGINVIDNEYQNPMEKDMVVRDALKKSPAERAKIIGSSFKNEYTGQLAPVVKPTPPAPNLGLPELSGMLGDVASAETDYSYNKGASDQVAELERITSIQDFDGLVQ